ncbi:uncharacterized protein [Chelonus insularis]|uniref:uncharacterized protein n=1 Tax=Chelonus insularis TaxID=460826 RepID=UPI0015884C0C|nr:uncharacterized protein LOC118074960 [Chelonus insularis]
MSKGKENRNKSDKKWMSGGFSYYKVNEYERNDGVVTTHFACIKEHNKNFNCPATGHFINNIYYTKEKKHTNEPDPLLIQRRATYKRAKDLSVIRGINAGQNYSTSFLLENSKIAEVTPPCKVRRTLQKKLNINIKCNIYIA